VDQHSKVLKDLLSREHPFPHLKERQKAVIMSTTSAEKPAEKNSPDPSEGPLFVVGVPRSGTSLLYALLNQHPQIALLYEGDLPALWPLFLTRRSKLQWRERWNFWNGSIERHRIDASRIPADVPDIRMATEIAYRQYAQKKNASIWGCKTPNQYDSLVQLAALFPSARFVMIQRDPADICRSIIRASKNSAHFEHKGLTHRALLGCYRLELERGRLLQRGVPIHVLQYQDLVRSPEDELMKICGFLGIPFHSNMASLENADRSAVMQGAHNTLVRGERIVASRQQPEVLPVRFGRKIERYKNLWRQKHVDWAIPSAEESNLTKPSLLERAYDELLYRLLRTWDLFVVFVYCFGPVRLLTAYRAWKGNPHLMRFAFASKGAGKVREVATHSVQSSARTSSSE
jgi:Sulfotransferase family